MQTNKVEGFARVVSRVLGWIYTLSWSLSFYPQPILNWRRRTTTGFAIDYAALNVVGFLCYTISTAAFLFSPTVIHQYALRHPFAPKPTVQVNDLAFAAHALVCCILVLSQFWHRLWHFEGRPGRTSPTVIGIICGSAAGVAIIAIIAWQKRGKAGDSSAWATIDVIYALSYVKLLITITKYVPQVLHNYDARSTVGWAIETIMLDFTGGILSLVQLIIDSAQQSNWIEGITGNPVKFGLSIISLFFDIVFMTQHYVLYGHEDKSAHDDDDDDAETHEGGSEQTPLLD